LRARLETVFFSHNNVNIVGRDVVVDRGRPMDDVMVINPEASMLIDGKLVEAETGTTFENVNPATETVLGRVADASAADMQRATAAARRASPLLQGAASSSAAGLRRARPRSRRRDARCC
jgi:hypothetical protein